MDKITCKCGSTNIISRETTVRTGPPKKIPGHLRHKLVSYGYQTQEHMCADCAHQWRDLKDE